jgi:hypothetical protein
MAVGNIANTLGTATGVWSNGQLVAGAPGNVSNDGASNTVSVEQWDKYIATITQAMAASSGFQRMQFEAQVKDAQAARQNAMKIAQLQAETSRYGVDVGRQNLLAQLTENARQFDQNHALDLQKLGLEEKRFGQAQYEFGQTFGEGQRQFNVTSGENQRQFNVTAGQNQQRIGLDYAKTATDYLSTPDRFFQAGDYINMGRQALNGQGPQPYGATGSPVPKTTDEFAVLAGYTQPGEQPYAGGPAGSAQNGQGAMPGGGQGRASDQAPDPRLKALRGVFEAIPPSNEAGVNDNDFAALQAARAIYSTNLKPGTLQRMRPGQLAMNRSAGARLGVYVPDWEQDVARYGVGQGSSRAA